MKRNMDLIRNILLDFETGENWVRCQTQAVCDAVKGDQDDVVPDDVAAARQYHMILLEKDGFIEASNLGGGWLIERMTTQGHDFIDAVRDEEIYRETKRAAKAVGGWTLGTIKDIATGIIKTKIKKHSGIDL